MEYLQKRVILMRKYILLSLFLSLYTAGFAMAQVFEAVEYKPLSKEECVGRREKLGLEYCPSNKDHLAGAAKACGHIDNLPSMDELFVLARKVYHVQSVDKYIDGIRDDSILQEMNIFAPEKNIFYWSNVETKNRRGMIRMFAPHSSYPYYVMRDGSAYVPMRGSKRGFNNEILLLRGLKSERKRQFENKVDAPGFINNDVLMAICVRKYPAVGAFETKEKNNPAESQPNLRGFSRDSSCAILCGKDYHYHRAKNIEGVRTYMCNRKTSQKKTHSCSPRESTYNNVKYICECN